MSQCSARQGEALHPPTSFTAFFYVLPLPPSFISYLHINNIPENNQYHHGLHEIRDISAPLPFTPSLRYNPHLFLSNTAPLSCIGKVHLTEQNLHITRLTLQYDLVYYSISIRLYTSYLKSFTEIRIVKKRCVRNNTGACVRFIGYEQYYLIIFSGILD